ncbi:hypothetical protein OIE61_43230 [Streptomyces sp. NBC_01762]|uniref:hypothetical protein n=1 Tax=Streptomyces sp. NBC_01762 TaxID=2975933 RepID=UPI002DD7FB85|nr:hypothetical protein [Streptomyces sp. NBC_01762]WSC42742.1 hypothetical protein OIE61_01250 [Streptomyces sp. NBC_01762]WSC50113.1 hypothetical protein OIE61_43230 [Streptomyces sp. NBC_01762]
MHTVDLAHVGRGLHEELAAYIADQQDYYADEGVHVALRDGCGCGCGCGWDEERVRRGVTNGLGRALLSRLTDATPGPRSMSTPTARCSGSSPAPARPPWPTRPAGG